MNKYRSGSNANIGDSLKRGLLAHYPLVSNANDISGNGNNGTTSGTVTFGSNGVSFASGAYVNLPVLFSGSSNRSVSFKFNAPSAPGGYENTIYAAGTTSSSQLFGVGITGGGTILRFFGYNNDIDYTWESEYYGVEHHVVMIYASGCRKWYINKTLITNQATTLNTSSANHRIGTLLGDTFNGTVRDLRIWNREILEEEVAKL
jgi:hypothetical protein